MTNMSTFKPKKATCFMSSNGVKRLLLQEKTNMHKDAYIYSRTSKSASTSMQLILSCLKQIKHYGFLHSDEDQSKISPSSS